MATAIQMPSAWTLFHTMANQYPSMQKSAPTPPTTFSVQPSVQTTKGAPRLSNIPPPVPPKTSATLPAVKNAPAPGAPQSTTASTAVPMNAPPPTPPSSSPLCDFCHLRPKHNDGKRLHPYCTRSCAKAKAATIPKSANCDYCHVKPKYFDGNKTYLYCGKACAKTALSKVICQAPGCQKPAFVNSNGSFGDYCSISHKTLMETICLYCQKAAKRTNSHFCSQACIEEVEKNGPMLLEVPVGHATFKSVTEQFKTSWRHPTTCPEVKRIYKIVSPKSSLASYNAYRTAVEAKGQFVSQGRSAGNENRRWHGTRRACSLGDPGQTQFCTSTTCSLCCIIRSSFDLSMWGKKTGWGRFGKGIYTSSTSSKSNDYSSNDSKSSLKAILLNKVVVGKGCKMTQDNVSLIAPPAGYDSVLAEKGGTLNYDELVVYSNDAIRPSFLVMYEP